MGRVCLTAATTRKSHVIQNETNGLFPCVFRCKRLRPRAGDEMWFEETICKLSALCHLDRLIALCGVFRIDNRIKDWIVSCRNANLGSVQNNCREYLRQNLDILGQPSYQRGIYSNLSTTMLPLFQENPCLWKITLHFGDMRRWPTLDALFHHLRETADESYSLSLEKLKRLLIG